MDAIDHQVMGVLFNQLDADSDGKLSMKELMALFGDMTAEAREMIKPFFDACDKDGDKRITLEEFKEFYKAMEDSSDEEEEKKEEKKEEVKEEKKEEEKKEEKTYGGMTEETMEKLFKSLDADSDGKLVMNELRALVDAEASDADIKPFFDACDTDGDKKITLEEFKAFYKGMGEDAATTEGDKQEKPEESTSGGMTEETMEKLFKSLDADSDGKLVMKELKALVDAEASDADMKPFFDACDTDGDKKITLEEFKAFYKDL